MAKKRVTKYVIVLILGALLIICGVFCSIYLESDGLDCTAEYNIYKEVKDIQTLGEARSQLKELKIEYVVTEKKLTLNNYSNISFKVNPDNTCTINTNRYMSCFEKLDAVDLSVVQIQGIMKDGKFIEKFTMISEPVIFTKVNGHYYVKLDFVVWFALVTYGAGTTLATISIVHLISKRSKAKDNLCED